MGVTSQELTIRYTGDAKGVQSTLGKIGGMHDSISKKLSDVGRSWTRNVTLPIGLAGAASFKAASDLNESLSKANVVFGKSADAVVAWSETSAEAFGQSQQEALEAAGTYGNLLQAFGVTRGEAQKMSTSMVELAADLASFNNASPEDTLLAIRSGLVGETEPLRKFGVALSAARVEEEALRMGLVRQGQELSAAAKAQAAYSLIMKDTKLAQGDFARTSEGAANQLRILKASAIDAAAGLGKVLLPIGTKLIGMFRGAFEWLSNLPEPAKKVVVVVAAIAAAIGPLLIVTAKLISSYQTVAGAIGKVVGVFVTQTAAATADAAATGAAATATWTLNTALLATIATVALVAVAIGAIAFLIIKNWDKVKAFLLGAWDAIKTAAQAAWNAIRGVIEPVVTGIVEVVKAAMIVLVPIWQTAWEIVSAVVKAAWAVIQAVIVPTIKVVWAIVKAVLSVMVAYWKMVWKIVATVVKIAWGIIRPVVATAVKIVWNVIKGALVVIAKVWKATWSAVKAVATAVWSAIKAAIIDPVKAIWSTLKSVLSSVWNFWKGVWTKAKDFVLGIWDGIYNGIRTVVNAVIGVIEGIVNAGIAAYNWVANLPLNPMDPVDKVTLPRMARGGVVERAGLALVGERGPEVVAMSRGARVVPLSGGMSGVIQITLDRRRFGRSLEHEYVGRGW